MKANKIGDLSVDYTQRSRSFLYASMAASVAKFFGLKEICFYENGILSVNLPLCQQEVGTRATRTTHPQALDGFGRIFSLVMGEPFAVTNEFLWQTKQDVLETLKRSGHVDLARDSLSCTHTRQFTKVSPHCGMCSQCLSRRIAALGADYGDNDPATGYRKDVLVDPRDKDEDRIMAERFVGAALQIEQMTSVDEFHQAYAGELGRVYPYIELPSTEAAARLFDLHHRHARQVGEVMSAQMALHADERRRGMLADGCMLNYVFDAGRPQPSARAACRQHAATGDTARAVVDVHTFTIRFLDKSHRFKGRSKLLFALFERINRHPGCQVPFEALREKNDVWDGAVVEDVTIRGAVTRLKKTLIDARMAKLATAISTGHFQNRPFVILNYDGDDSNSN